MAGHHWHVGSPSVSLAASSYLFTATRQSLAAYALLPSLNAFIARTWFMYPQPASVTLRTINSARYAAEDRILIKIPLCRTRSRAASRRVYRGFLDARNHVFTLRCVALPASGGRLSPGLAASISLDTGNSHLGIKPIENLVVIRFEDLLEKVKSYNPEADVELLRRAYVFSALEHKGQIRHSGEPYLVHPLEVADSLADMKLDVVAVAAGLLHDVVEDTLTTPERIQELFGKEIAHVVEGVTKIGAIPFSSSEERQAENFRKMLLAMVDDIRVILVKLADRLHNMRTLHHLPEDRRVRIAQETRDIYAPIAHRRGMSKLKNELEELAFRYIEPAAYNALRQQVETRRRATEGLVDELRKRLGQKLEEAQIPVVVIEGRIKRLWSIHQKLQRQHVALDQVYDFLALRVITRNVKDCYAVLGIIHQMWSPVPGRFKDFIAMSRPNGYQSLHTSVVSERGVPFEVQIRPEEMHRVAEEGIAAHWKYKEGRVGAERDEQYFHWLRQLVEWQQETRDPTEFMQNLRIELYAEE